MSAAQPFGLFAAFDGPDALLDAVRELRQRGYRAIDAYTSFPVEGLDHALGLRASPVGWLILAGVVLGAIAAYGIALYSTTVAYPINVGGRPLHAWPPFALLAFEGGILGGTIAAFLGMLVLTRLPTYHHPVFDFAGMDFARGRCFVLMVSASDARYDRGALGKLLTQIGATQVAEVGT